jgi:Spy/CpxP family protein refolding chaperone
MNRILAITTALALGGIGLTAIASPYERGPHGYDTNTRVERMAEHLNLTNEQQEKIKAMFDAHKKERQARRENMHEEISGVLNDEQKSRFDAMKQYRQEKRANRMAKHDGKYCDHSQRGYGHRPFAD